MEDWQQRLVTERSELAEKLVRLSRWLESDAAMGIEAYPRILLIRQRSIMLTYLGILDERIGLFQK